MKQIVFALAVCSALGVVAYHELIFQADLFEIGESLAQMDVDQLTRRFDMEPTEILTRMEAKATQLKFEVVHVEVSRSPQLPKNPDQPVTHDSLMAHDYAVHAVLTREFLFGRFQTAHLVRSWRSTCPHGPSDAPGEHDAAKAVDPPPDP